MGIGHCGWDTLVLYPDIVMESSAKEKTLMPTSSIGLSNNGKLGGRVERTRIYCRLSPVREGLVLVLGLVHWVFWSPVNSATHKDGDADLIFQQDLVLTQSTRSSSISMVSPPAVELFHCEEKNVCFAKVNRSRSHSDLLGSTRIKIRVGLTQINQFWGSDCFLCFCQQCVLTETCPVCVWAVEGGQRAIIFNRIGGMQMDTILAEGLHFRYTLLPSAGWSFQPAECCCLLRQISNSTVLMSMLQDPVVPVSNHLWY